VSLVALAVGSVPVLAATADGRWHLPSADAGSALGFLAGADRGDYRVLWVGAPAALPLAGRQLHPGIAYATSYNGPPDVADLWVTRHEGASPLLADDLRLVEDHLTTKLGHLLGTAGVQYIVVPNHSGPAGSGAPATPTPTALLAGLTLQTDLQVVNADPDYTVYRNAAWAPARAVLRPVAAAAAAAPTSRAERAAEDTDLAGSAPVLSGGRPGRARGPLSGPATLYVADTYDGSWRLQAAGQTVAPQPAFGWAMRFAVPAGASARAVVSSKPSFGTRAAQWLQVALWILAGLAVAVDARRRQVRRGAGERVDPAWFAPSIAGADHAPRRRGTGSVGAEDVLSDEMWIDA
jgi:hypothetical protein